MKMKRKSTAVLVAALVAACGLWFALRPSKQTGITLETAATSRITIRNSVTATGTVEPVTEVEVGTQVSGIIDRLYVDYNDVVKAGQLIAEMDKVTLQAELESSQAELASCKTEYEYRMKEYSRTRTLHEKELVSDAEYDEALYLYEKARNAYEQAQAAIALAVPTKALRFVPDGELLAALGLRAEAAAEAEPGKRELWVKQGTTLVPRYVTAGSASGELTEIVDGLNDGEEVAVCLTAERTEPEAAAERSPFMPAPPGGDKKKK